MSKQTTVLNVSNPPTQEELEHMVCLDPSKIPKKFTRELDHRVFVNRTVNMESISYIGFDMDYTLAVYKSPAMEQLGYNLTVQKLIKRGYPAEIAKLQYDPAFPIRGLFIDTKLGLLVKVDVFGYILNVVKGRKVVENIRQYYPDKIIHPEEENKRFYMIDTLFGLPEACLYADLVEFFETNTSISLQASAGTEKKKARPISFRSLFEDIRESIDSCHKDGSLKSTVLKNPDHYIVKTDELPLFLHRLQSQGKKTFLMTNSEYYYADAVMSFLLNGAREDKKSWVDYFDIIITSARKPTFFEDGTTLREVDQKTGTLKFTETEDFEKGKVYAGGSLKLFQQFTKTHGSEILFVGDNIYHDVVYSKKSLCLWRTMLIVRELNDEISSWKNNVQKYSYLQNLEYLRARTYQGLDSSNETPVTAQDLKQHIKTSIDRMDASFNKWFGSVFRSGHRESFFSYQVQRYSDLYASSHLNLLHYPLFYYFSAQQMLLPHEREAAQEDPKNATME